MQIIHPESYLGLFIKEVKNNPKETLYKALFCISFIASVYFFNF
jgi:hypothetical protein